MRSALVLAAVFVGAVSAGGCQDSLVTREIGARCDTTDECDDRCLPASEGFPGGLCTIDCNVNADCTVRTACVEDQGGVCLYTCDVVQDCEFLGLGWTCVEVESRAEPATKVKVCRGS